MTVVEAAKRTGLAPVTIRNRCGEGVVPGAVRRKHEDGKTRWDVPESAIPSLLHHSKATKQSAPADAEVGSDVFDGKTREVTRLTTERVRNERDLIRVCEVDEALWEVRSWKCKVYEGLIKTDDNVAQDPPPQMFSVQASFQPRPGASRFQEILEAQVAAYVKKTPKPLKHKKPRLRRVAEGLMWETGQWDHHFAALCWGKETGWGDWDLETAMEAWRESTAWSLAELARQPVEEVWYILGNDLFDADTSAGETFRGTRLDVDSRHQKAYVAVGDLLVETLRSFLEVAPVRVIAVYGNHDPTSTFHLAQALRTDWRLRGAKHFEVDNRPLHRKYYRWGRALLCFTHGEGTKAGVDRMVAAIPREAGRLGLWDSADIREAHAGHLHKKSADEADNGVMLRRMRTLYPPNAWAAGNAFVGAVRGAEALLWDKEAGLTRTAVYTPRDEVSRRVA